MRKGIVSVLFVVLGLVFSQATLAGEKGRVMKAGHAHHSHKHYGKGYHHKKHYGHDLKQSINKVGHPVYIAFPDRK